MKRRDALKNTGLLVGLGLASGAMTSAMFQSCKEAQTVASGDWQPAFIPADLVEMVAEITETILPKTSTPGAKDVKVHQFLDAAWNLLYKPEERDHIKKGLMAFDGDCEVSTGKAFLELTAEERLAYLQEVEAASDIIMDEIDEAEEAKKTEVRQEPAESEIILKPFWAYVKSNTLVGYFTSEEIGENFLNYDPVPGQAIGCMDLTEGMKVYSLPYS